MEPTSRCFIQKSFLFRDREIASLTPMFAGVTYERLEGFKSLQWPVAPDGTDQPLLYTKEFSLPRSRDCVVDADVRGCDLRTARRIQVLAMAGGTRWNRPAAALYKRVFSSGWQG